MTESVQPSAETTPLDPRQLLLPSLTAMVHDLSVRLPPSSAVQALQTQQLLQQMAQAVQMGQLPALGLLLQAMQTALQHYADGETAQTDKTGELLHLAAKDAHGYLQALSDGQPCSTQMLFPSYRALSKIHGKDTAHPAQLWESPWPTPVLLAPPSVQPLAPSPAVRAQLDQYVLALLQTGNPTFCNTLQPLSLGLAAHAQDATTWMLAAAWLDAIEYGLLELDIYAKRLASRLLAHYASAAKGQEAPAPTLLRDLMFFCAQAVAHAAQHQYTLPDTLEDVVHRCQAAAAAQASEHGNTAPAEATRGTESLPPATRPPRPHVPAPALPQFQAAAEIEPAATLLQGLANSAQITPDSAFLHEAESLSLQLESAITAWLTEDAAPDLEHMVTHTSALSHLAWTSGCTEIANIAHLLQRCLQRMPSGTPLAQRQTCQYASAEIHRLLHQFAAGFMRRAHPQVMDALHQLLAQLPEPSAPLPAPPVLTDALPAHTTHETADSPEDSEAPGQSDPTLSANRPDIPAPYRARPVLDALHFSVFEEEILATWPKLQSALTQWTQHPQDSAARAIVLRCLHTLKGSARLAGVMAWASQVHAVESLALEAQASHGARGPASLAPVLETLRLAFVALQQEMAERHPERLHQRLHAQPLETVGRHTQALWSTQEAGQQAFNTSQVSLHEIAAGLQKLRTQIKDCAAWADSLMLHGDLELPYEWHEELHDLVRALNDCTDDLGTAQQQLQHGIADVGQALSSHSAHLRALQHTLLFARLQPLSHLQERLTHCVQLACQDTGKAVDVLWQGTDTPMERSVLQALTPALEHLLRNCVAHGIEDTALRHAQHKAPSGKIQIRLHNAGSQQLLSLQDDGAGLDTTAIRHKALALGLIEGDEPVDNARAASLILEPGLSTAPAITELAGRGIGMDVVAETIAQLGGKLRITSSAGQGCRFDITLPAPPQVEQILALRAGSWHVAVPARSVEAIRRIPTALADQALAQGVLQDDDSGPLPLYWAGAVWQQSTHSMEPPLDGLRCLLVVRSDTARWGLIVDEVQATQEVTLQAATDLAVPIAGLLGMAAQASGQVLQVYEPSAVLSAHDARVHALHSSDAMPTPPVSAPELPLVLLADDSMSVRRLAQHLLQTQGYRVNTAADGLQALQMLEAGPIPALLIADVEMPDMDGMELLRRVRADARFKQLPVVMLTAHTAGPVSQKAIDMGAQAFLTKPYSPNELLAQVHRYTTMVQTA